MIQDDLLITPSPIEAKAAGAGRCAAPVLYISYDGMLEPLGQSQVLAYLVELCKTRRIHLISFEKPKSLCDQEEWLRIETLMRSARIDWRPLKYHKSPTLLATAWDILRGTAIAMWIASRHNVRIVHARSYVAATMALCAKIVPRTKFVFDMRGFWVDERVDGGLWRRDSKLYLVAKRFEQLFLCHADHIVSLTHAAKRIIRQFPYMKERQTSISVIPTCADLARFHADGVEKAEGSPYVLGYLGSVGTWYMFDEVCQAFALFLKSCPDGKILIVNHNEHALVKSKLQLAGVDEDRVMLVSAPHREIPSYIRRMDSAIFFIRQAFSKQASAPTKLAELLGCGVPCLTNTGVGDMASIIEEERVGVAISSFDTESLSAGLAALLAMKSAPETGKRCSDAAEKYFSLSRGVAAYERIYDQLDADL